MLPVNAPILLPHQKRLMDFVRKGIIEIKRGSNSVGILIPGPSGSGKTHGLDGVAAEFQAHTVGYQRCVPCCRVAASSTGDFVTLCQSILAQLGKPLSATNRLKPGELEAQVYAALLACAVRVLILEEMNNALLSSTKLLRSRVAQFLKNLWNMYSILDPTGWAVPSGSSRGEKLIIIVSGTEALEPVFGGDPELDSRFSCRVPTRLMWFNDPQSLHQFKDVLGRFFDRFGMLGRPALMEPDFVARSLFACGGHLRRLETLISRAATLEATLPDATTLTIMAQAYGEVLQKDSEGWNPYLCTNEELRQRVKVAMGHPPPGSKQ